MCRANVCCIRYAGTSDDSVVSDAEEVVAVSKEMSEDEATLILQRVLSHQHNSLPLADSVTAVVEGDVLEKLRAASDDDDERRDDGDATQQQEFVINAQRFLASSSLSLDNCHKNLTVIRGLCLLFYCVCVVLLTFLLHFRKSQNYLLACHNDGGHL